MGSGEAAGEWLPRVGSARYCRARRLRAKCDRGRIALGLDRGRERPPRGDPGRHRGAGKKPRDTREWRVGCEAGTRAPGGGRSFARLMTNLPRTSGMSPHAMSRRSAAARQGQTAGQRLPRRPQRACCAGILQARQKSSWWEMMGKGAHYPRGGGECNRLFLGFRSTTNPWQNTN